MVATVQTFNLANAMISTLAKIEAARSRSSVARMFGPCRMTASETTAITAVRRKRSTGRMSVRCRTTTLATAMTLMLANSKAASARLTAVPMLAPCRTRILRVTTRDDVKLTAALMCVLCRMANLVTTAGLQAAVVTVAVAQRPAEAAVRFMSAHPAAAVWVMAVDAPVGDHPAVVAARHRAEAASGTAADTPAADHPAAGAAHRLGGAAE